MNTAHTSDGDDLSPDADRWLDEAGEEFNFKQTALTRQWLGQLDRWEFSASTGVLTLFHPDGSRSIATAEILGSFSPEEATWEWAWNNPNMPQRFTRKSLSVKSIGEQLGLEYLVNGVVPIRDDAEELTSYLCSIGVKATAAAGIFRGGDERLPVYFLVFEPTHVGP